MPTLADAQYDLDKEKRQMNEYIRLKLRNTSRAMYHQVVKRRKIRCRRGKGKQYSNRELIERIVDDAISEDGTSFRAMFEAGIGTEPRTDYDRITANDCHFWIEIDGKIFDPTPNNTKYKMNYKAFPLLTQCRIAKAQSSRVKEMDGKGKLEMYAHCPQPRACWYNCMAWKKYHPDAIGKKARIVIGSAGYKIHKYGTFWEYG